MTEGKKLADDFINSIFANFVCVTWHTTYTSIASDYIVVN